MFYMAVNSKGRAFCFEATSLQGANDTLRREFGDEDFDVQEFEDEQEYRERIDGQK